MIVINDLIKEKMMTIPNVNTLSKEQLAILMVVMLHNGDYNMLLGKGFNTNQMLILSNYMNLSYDITLALNPKYSVEFMEEIIEVSNSQEYKEAISRHINQSRTIDEIKMIISLVVNDQEQFLDKYSDLIGEVNPERIMYAGFINKEGYDENILLNEEIIHDSNVLYAVELLLNGKDIQHELISDFSPTQQAELLRAIDEDLCLDFLLNESLSSLQMRQIRIGLAFGLNVSSYAKTNLSAKEMKAARITLMQELPKPEFKLPEVNEAVNMYNKLLSKLS